MKAKEHQNYISLTEAAKLSPYTQEYLSLRARQKKLKAIKIGRNWVTTKQWLDDYVDNADLYKNGGNKSLGQSSLPEPPEDLPIELTTQDLQITRKRVPVSVFAAFRFGFAVAMIALLLSFGTAFGKDGWYRLGRELAGSMQDLGKGFNDASLKMARTFAADVNQFAEGLDSGSVKQVRQLSLVVNSFGNGFKGGSKEAVTRSHVFVQNFGQGFHQSISENTRNLAVFVQDLGEGFDLGVRGTTKDLDITVQDFGIGFLYGLSAPAAVGDFASEYIGWLKQGIVSLPQNLVQSYLAFNKTVEQGMQKDAGEAQKGYALLNQRIEQGLKKDTQGFVHGYENLNSVAHQGLLSDFQGLQGSLKPQQRKYLMVFCMCFLPNV